MRMDESIMSVIDVRGVSVRIECGDGSVFDVLIFEEDDVWVSHILDADQVTQGIDIGDAVNMAIDAMESIPSEHRTRPAPDDECSNHAIRRIEKDIDKLRGERDYFRDRASPRFEDVGRSGITYRQAKLWPRNHGVCEIQDGWNINFMVRLGGEISDKNEFDIMEEMLSIDEDEKL